jgi:hypothetical protein
MDVDVDEQLDIYRQIKEGQSKKLKKEKKEKVEKKVNIHIFQFVCK